MLSYGGLHMVEDPERAIDEIARCLESKSRGGQLRMIQMGEACRRANHALMVPPVVGLH